MKKDILSKTFEIDKEIHESMSSLLTQQLAAKQKLEFDQHKQQQNYEARELYKEERERQKKALNDFEAQWKATLKNDPNKKNEYKEKKEEIKARLAKEDSDFQAKDKKTREDEDNEFKEHQTQQSDKLQKQIATELDNLQKTFQDDLSAIVKEQDSIISQLQLSSKQEYIKLFDSQVSSKITAFSDFDKARIDKKKSDFNNELKYLLELQKGFKESLLAHHEQQHKFLQNLFQTEKEEKDRGKKGSSDSTINQEDEISKLQEAQTNELIVMEKEFAEQYSTLVDSFNEWESNANKESESKTKELTKSKNDQLKTLKDDLEKYSSNLTYKANNEKAAGTTQ